MQGCMTHSANHKDLELQYGIPEWMGKLTDVLFEGMKNEHSKEFFINFVKTITRPSFLGFDNWQHIYHQLCLHILEKECKNIDHPLVKQVICDIMTLHRTEERDKEKWSAAGSAAASAGSAAWSAAGSAARSAGSAAGSVARSAWSAAWSAEFAAWSAAESVAWSVAGSAAESVARSAEFAAESAAKSVAKSAAKSAAYKSIADKLLELLKVKHENPC